MKENYKLFKLLSNNIKSDNLLDYLISFLNDEEEINTIDDINLKSLANNEPIKIIELIGIAMQKNTEREEIFNTNKRKHYGIYFTDYTIAKKMSDELIKNLTINKINSYTFYEPCLGGGIFIIAYIDSIIEKFGLNNLNLQKIINNIYYSDIEELFIVTFKKILPAYLYKKYKIKIIINENNSYVGDVLFSKKENNITKNDPRLIFNILNGFDLILTNPPYRLLKANNDKYFKHGVNIFADDTKDLISFIKENNIYKYNSGTLNLYKIFIEEILENYTHSESKIGLLIPNTLLNDKQSEDLRIRILDSYKIEKIFVIKEKNNFFPDITQSLIFFNIEKNSKTNNIEIIKDIINEEDLNCKGITISLKDISLLSESKPIVIEDKLGYDILKKISKYPKLKNNTNILNLRGELDLTLHKKYITKNNTNFKLVKGANIEEFSLKGDLEYVNDSFIDSIKNKSFHIKKERLCCQQISNMTSKKRLKFLIVQPNHVLGNSCNYILLDENTLFSDTSITLEYLLALLNSNLLDWRFRLTNSNNHVSNYEIHELPIPIPKKEEMSKLINVTKKIIKDSKNKELMKELNNIVYNIFNLTNEEIKYLSNKYI